jgi:hypothetical protein
VQRQARESAHKQAIIDKLTHENAVLKRLKFAAQSERFSSEQRSLLRKRSTPICRRCPKN